MFKDRNLDAVWEKVQGNVRISPAEALALYESPDLLGLGKVANSIKEKKTGNSVTFVVNRQINPTNLCVLSCKFCDFASKKGRPNAYVMSMEDILSKCSPDLREVHIVGGLHHEWKFEHYLSIVREIHERFPQIQIKAYTAVEIDFFAKIEKCSVREILTRLKDAGLVCLPGGGAEVFSERVRQA